MTNRSTLYLSSGRLLPPQVAIILLNYFPRTDSHPDRGKWLELLDFFACFVVGVKDENFG